MWFPHIDSRLHSSDNESESEEALLIEKFHSLHDISISFLTHLRHNGIIYPKTFTVLLDFSVKEAVGMEFGRERYLKQLLEREHGQY